MSEGTFLLFAVMAIAGAVACNRIAHHRGADTSLPTLLGILVWPVGLIVAFTARPLPRRNPRVPVGMWEAHCSRCQAANNVPGVADEWTCWQCQAEHYVTQKPIMCGRCGEANFVPATAGPWACGRCHTTLAAAS